MAWRRAEFYFAVRDLLVRSEVLGTKLEFGRSGFRVEILFPGNGVDRHWEPLGSLRHVFRKETHEQGFAVQTLKVMVFAEGPRGRDTEASIEHLRKSFQVAQAVVGELVEWARIRGQAWLGLHGQPVRRIGNHLLGDDSVDIADYGFSEDVLPQIEEEHTPEFEIEASLDSANASSLAERLARNGEAVPIAETLLADALYFIGLNPPDWQRAVLIAAIACEVKVKDTLRRKVLPDRLPFVDLILENPRDWSIAAVALFDKAMNAALGRSLRAERQEVYKDITKLFEVRNRIAHRGEKPDDEDARRVVLAGREVFRWLDGL
jgi:hypothetical protein